MPTKVVKKRPRKKRKKRGHYQRGEYTSTKTGQVCKHRSGWERKYMEWLDANPEVHSWSYELIAIEYTSNKKTGKVRKYYPDFSVTYVDGTHKLIEVKPKRKLDQAVIVKKAMAAVEWCRTHCMTYEIVTEVQLKELGLL